MKSLYAKLSVALFGFFLLVGAGTLAITLATSHMYQKEVQQRIHHNLARQIVASEPLIAGGEIATEALEQVFHMMMVINPTIELYLLDPSGRVLAYSAPPKRVKQTDVDLAPVRELIDGNPRLPVEGDDPRHPGTSKIFSAARIVRDGQLEGYLYIVLASEEFVSVADLLRGSYTLRAGALAVIGITGLALLGALLLSRHLTRRLTRLSKDISVFKRKTLKRESGEADDELPDVVVRHDEIDELRVDFDEMAARIGDQIEKLEQQDRFRREMVANVSHDLRTPLSHLQGYIETLMLKEETLETEDRREYLEIALQHAQRLGRLVSDLFDLAKLDALEEPLERERIPVGELVQDVTQKYRLRAADRGISLIAEIAGDLIWISADLGMIERALENVLENALRFTPDGGSIDVKLAPLGDWLRIEIHDTGSGISASDVPRIFERFQRVATIEDGHRRRGAGLGLAIAKRAIELHGGTIHCESRVGEGTTFRFELPAETFFAGVAPPSV